MIRLLAILIILLFMPRNEVKMSRVTLVDKLSKVANLYPDEMQLLSTMFNSSEIVSGWISHGKDPVFDFAYLRTCSIENIPLGYSGVTAASHAAIANTTLTAITWDTESVVNPGDFGLIDWSTGTKIVAKSNHTFFFDFRARFASDADGYRYVTMKVFNADDSELYDPEILVSSPAVNGEVTVLSGSFAYPMKTGQYVILYVYHSAGGNLAVVPTLRYFAVK